MKQEGKRQLLILLALVVIECITTLSMAVTSGIMWDVARAANVIVFVVLLINLAKYLAYLMTPGNS